MINEQSIGRDVTPAETTELFSSSHERHMALNTLILLLIKVWATCHGLLQDLLFSLKKDQASRLAHGHVRKRHDPGGIELQGLFTIYHQTGLKAHWAFWKH